MLAGRVNGEAAEASERYVIIADADRHIAELVTTFLSKRLTTAWFADAQTAFEAARSQPPLLIIAEVLLPRLDGLTFCRLAKDDSRVKESKFLILSVLSAQQRALRSGADAFLMKPIERRSFLAAVEKLVPSALAANDT